ncbi:LysR family transcriptional regulator [uncultured Dysosmobacter sp.]|uniref:LysR family transcriptional regulator n=1 Tax=uncultured Dysosmobacter sp. TaxID=2591384 RepID=UPI002629DE6A|nr:LysR family transcriptional regulator [uncultured Dysosmobacter sp.]
MELRVLRYFLEVAREGSVTRAAERLHISQPTLSKQLKDLEGELGKKLFVRGSHDVKLTDEGMLLRKRAEDILNMADKTLEEFKSLGEFTGGDVWVGCAESDGIKHLARCYMALLERYPGLRLHLQSGNSADVTERLDRGLLDFAIIVHEVDLSKYNYLELPATDHYGVLMRKDSPLASKEAVGVDDLLDLPLICSRQGITEDYPKVFQQKMDALRIVATFNLAYNASVLVREGVGYALTFDKLADTSEESELTFRPLMPPLETKMYMIWKKYQVFSPAAEVLQKEVLERFGRM